MRNSLRNNSNSVNISYWELKHFFAEYDLIIIGSGIVGLSSAIHFKTRWPKAKVLILEKGLLPSGASTKNAGFACFGSPSELFDDLKKMPEETVWDTVRMRFEGLQLLRKTLSDKELAFTQHGGFELYSNKSALEQNLDRIHYLNKFCKNILKTDKVYSNATSQLTKFGFKNISGIIKNRLEGQIDTALLNYHLLQKVRSKGIEILNGINVTELIQLQGKVDIKTNFGTFKSKNCIVAVNGFANDLLKLKNVEPARAQVLITTAIKNLKIKGTFHYQEGYYYFRNIDDRILFGGGRNLDFNTERTSEIGITSKIQNQLESLLKTSIIPSHNFEIEHRWAGIMGIGPEKKPIVKHYSNNIVCAVRMGGMGIAIGSLVGKQAAELIN